MLVRMTETCDDLETIDACAVRSVQCARFGCTGGRRPISFRPLEEASYLAAWKGMLAGESVPGWASHYAKTFDGPATPSKSVAVGSETYTLAWVCKAYDCGDNQLNVFRLEANALGCLATVGKRAGSANLTPRLKPPFGSGAQ